jgi:hypothetical protein
MVVAARRWVWGSGLVVRRARAPKALKRARARRRVAAVLARAPAAASAAAMWGWFAQAMMSRVERLELTAAERCGRERPWVRKVSRRAWSWEECGMWDVGCRSRIGSPGRVGERDRLELEHVRHSTDGVRIVKRI